MSRRSIVCLPLLATTALVPLAMTAAAQTVKPVLVECPEGQPCLQPDGTITLDAITLSATRTEGAPIEALAGVSVVLPEALSSQGATRATDLLTGVPSVVVATDGTDQSTAINVRGLQDFGRVAITVDGARQNFRQSGHGVTGVFLPSPWLIGQATVVRGPIANVYGSGAIGGVVSFNTVGADDVLRADETYAVETRTSYETNGDGRMAGIRAAARVSDSFSVLAALTYDGNETLEDGVGAVIVGSDDNAFNGLVKAEIEANDFNRITASYLVDHDAYQRVASSTSAYDTRVLGQTASAKWSYDNPDDRLLDFDVSAYWTGTRKTETYVFGASAGRDRFFDVSTLGLDVANTSRFDTGPVTHAITIGADVFADDVRAEDVAGGTGAVSTPPGDRVVYGAFIQDEIGYSDWLTVAAAVRFDGYDFEGTDTSGNPVTGDGSRFSPKLAIGVTPFEQTALRGLEFYGSYSEGYRAPSVTETLVSGPHPGFTFLPNPNLQPETAHNFEIGVNFKRDDLFTSGDALRLKAGWFHNDVDNFIDGRTIFAPGMSYQYQNVKSATLEGFEFEANYDMGPVYGSLAASRVRGTDNSTNGPLGSTPADKIVTTLGFRFLDERATLGAQWEAVAAQKRVPSGTTPSESFNLVNVFASYELTDDLRLGLDVKNLFDAQYTRYLNDDPSPGLSVMFTLDARLGG